MDKQLQFDRSYLKMAGVWADNSYCQRRKVGALIVKDRMIISDGYNGTPCGFENVCEDVECAKLIIQSGIRRVVYRDSYRITDGLELMERAGIELLRIPAEEL